MRCFESYIISCDFYSLINLLTLPFKSTIIYLNLLSGEFVLFYSKLVLTLKFFLLAVIFISNASADEVGNKLFVVSPKSKPIMTTKSGTKIYPCNGYINKKLIRIIYNELKAISNANKILPPDGKICHYKIGNLKWGTKSIKTYNVDMYVSKSSMLSCVVKNYCSDFRSMFFKAKNKKLHRSYMVTNAPKKLTKMVCISNSGKIVSATKGC